MTSASREQMATYRYTGKEPATLFHRTFYPGDAVELWPGQAAQYPDLFALPRQPSHAEENVEATREDDPGEGTEIQAEGKPAPKRRASTRRTSTRSKSSDEAEADDAEAEVS